jgi:hypothetical protein
MTNIQQRPLVPLYTSRGDVEAFLQYPYIFNRSGEWIGFVTADRNVYSVLGNYVGQVSDDRRVLRKRTADTTPPQIQPPPSPTKIYPYPTVPLPPMMSELTFSTVDVLLEEPERLHTLDSGEMRQDMD